MKILVTGSKGFVGKNLVANLRNIMLGKDTTHPSLHIDEIYEYDIDTDPSLLDLFCSSADFVFNLAGVNRPKDETEFMSGNFGFASTLLDSLKRSNNKCPVMLSSSIQASLSGRYAGSMYAESKLAGENLFFDYGQESGVRVLVYRFPNLFGKWCRPNYNSVVATFCNNIANDLPINVNDPSTELELSYIDDVVSELIASLECHEHRCNYIDDEVVQCADGKYCYVPGSHRVSLCRIVELLTTFKEQSTSHLMIEMPADSFEKKLYATYLSYLPSDSFVYDFVSHSDDRGSFTELIKTQNVGQMSVNISRPGVTKGQHWHNSKWELFIVVSGHALIQQRDIYSGETLEYEVSGEKMQAVYMIPGFTHNLINLSDSDDLITLMWANETFDINHPDTFYEEV